MGTTSINIPFPIKGKHTDFSRANQPPVTAVDCLNVMPYDAGNRARGSHRPGLSKFYSADHGGAVSFLFIASTTAGVVKLISCGPNGTYINGVICTATGTSLPVAPNGMACILGTVYILDGSTLKQLNLSSGDITLCVATAGTLPSGCNRICAWRNRLVLAGGKNWYMSRVGAPLNFDYSATDVSRAVYSGGFASLSPGYVGDPIASLMPYSRDVLLFGLDREIWRMNGDPADHGQLEVVTSGEGVSSTFAWCPDTSGVLWILGTVGLYRYAGGMLEPYRQDTISAYFNQIVQNSYCPMVYDRDRSGLWIFSSEAGTMYWDLKQEGAWPQRFSYDVTAALVYDGNQPEDRRILIGCDDGYIRYLSGANTDDGLSFPWYVWFGPAQLEGAIKRFRVSSVDIIVAESSAACQIEHVTPDTVADGNEYTITVTQGSNTASVSYTADSTDDQDSVTAALIRAIFACPDAPLNTFSAGLFSNIMVGDGLAIYGQPGVAFTVTVAATGTGTISRSTYRSTTDAYSLDWTMQAGDTPYSAWGNPSQVRGGTIAGTGRQPTISARLNANAVFLRIGALAQNTSASFEQITFNVAPSGREH